jgi:hypothetical protein
MRIMWLAFVLLSLVASGCTTIGDLQACHPFRDPRSDSFITCAALRDVARQYPHVWARAMEIRAEREGISQGEILELPKRDWAAIAEAK